MSGGEIFLDFFNVRDKFSDLNVQESIRPPGLCPAELAPSGQLLRRVGDPADLFGFYSDRLLKSNLVRLLKNA